MSVVIRDFQPISTWELDSNGSKYRDQTPIYLIDTSTNKKYLNESKNCVRIKCFLLTLGTPIVHSIASLVNVVYRILKLVSFSHFTGKEGETPYSFKGRLKDAGLDLLRIVTTLIAFIGLELAAVYGVFTPYNGRKLYASIERAQYERFILAPCFQPMPTSHLFGGDMDKKDAF